MKELLFMLADLLMIGAGFYAGWRFISRYGNYLLGLEWMIVATSGVNFLVWALRGGDRTGIQYDVAFFFDAFSRSIGITLILVVGLMRVTHRYKPAVGADIGLFALAIGCGLYLQQFRDHALHVGPASFYLIGNLLTSAFLAYFVMRLWRIGAKRVAAWTALATVAATGIALTYDFFPVPEADPNRTGFYIAALATWGLQLFVYYLGYRALDEGVGHE
jgi:hypothetical protein